MSLKRRQFTKEFKLQVIREVEAGKAEGAVHSDSPLLQHLLSRRFLQELNQEATS